MARGSKGVGTALTWRGALGFWRRLVLARVSAMAFRPLLDALLSTGLASAGLLRRGLQPTKKKQSTDDGEIRRRGFRMAWLALQGLVQAATDDSTINQKYQLDDVLSLPAPSWSRPKTPEIKERQEQQENNDAARDNQRRTTTQHATTSNEQRQTNSRATHRQQSTANKKTNNKLTLFFLAI